MLKAGLVGVTGYTGMELARILAAHPSIRLVAATSRQDAGRRLDAVSVAGESRSVYRRSIWVHVQI